MKILTRIWLVLCLFTLNLPVFSAENINNELSEELPANLVYQTDELESFTKLRLDLVSSYIEIREGEDFQIEVYVSKDDVQFEDVFNYSNKNDQLTIDEKDWQNNLKSFLTSLTSRFVITVPDTSKLTTQIDLVNGEFLVKGTLAELKFDGVNASLTLIGDETYPIKIDIVDGDTNLSFKQYNAELNFSFVNGNFEILGDKVSATFSEFERTLGKGRDAIHIKAVNGSIVLEALEN